MMAIRILKKKQNFSICLIQKFKVSKAKFFLEFYDDKACKLVFRGRVILIVHPTHLHKRVQCDTLKSRRIKKTTAKISKKFALELE